MDIMSAETKDIMQALAQAQGSMEGAKKDSTNPFFKSKYADLASVWDACREPLFKNGLSIVQLTQVSGTETHLITMLCHSSGQWMKSVTPLPIDKKDPQTMGKCITYCRRYALAAMVGVYQEDDDAESITKREEKPAYRSNKKEERPVEVVSIKELIEPTIEEVRSLVMDSIQIPGEPYRFNHYLFKVREAAKKMSPPMGMREMCDSWLKNPSRFLEVYCKWIENEDKKLLEKEKESDTVKVVNA